MKIRFATSNPHKVAEANEAGREFGVEFEQIRVDYPEIRAEDVEDVAKDGAQYVFGKTKSAVIVEDTGLYIEALNGFPGAFSAFVHRKIGSDGILKLMDGVENRAAKFRSAIGWRDENGVKIFSGEVEGEINSEKRGEEGFGYDPIFVPKGQKKTFAEDFRMKNKVSHRRQAFEKFCKWVAGA